MRINRAITPPGLIKGAMCYSLFMTDKGLFVIKTGRGWRLNFRPRGAVNKMAANGAVQHLQKNVAAVESKLNVNNLDAEVVARKGSMFVPKADISDMEVKSRYDGLPELKMKLAGKKFRVQFDSSQADELAEFGKSI